MKIPTPLQIYRALPWILLGLALGLTVTILRAPAGAGWNWQHWSLGGCIVGIVVLALIDLLFLYNPWDRRK